MDGKIAPKRILRSSNDNKKVVGCLLRFPGQQSDEESGLGFETRAEANDALQEIKKNYKSSGWQEGTMMHRNGEDVLVPYGNGYAIYGVNKNGTVTLKTAITEKTSKEYVPKK